MREQSYVPYAAASGLAGRHSHILGVLVPSLSWPFIPDILQEAVNSSTATGPLPRRLSKRWRPIPNARLSSRCPILPNAWRPPLLVCSLGPTDGRSWRQAFPRVPLPARASPTPVGRRTTPFLYPGLGLGTIVALGAAGQ